jgi:hypothetical protein
MIRHFQPPHLQGDTRLGGSPEERVRKAVSARRTRLALTRAHEPVFTCPVYLRGTDASVGHPETGTPFFDTGVSLPSDRSSRWTSILHGTRHR